MSNIGRALLRLYGAKRTVGAGSSRPSNQKPDAPPDTFAQVTRQMVEDIRTDIGDLKAIQRLEFSMIAGVVITEILRFVLAH